MADNVIKVSVTSTKSQRVSVSSSQQATNITANSDTGRFWSQVSKNWAVSENIVDNEDYSSKYYANKSKQSAQNAESYLESTREIHNNFASDASSYINELTELKDAGAEEINEAVASGKDEINSAKTTILNDIEFVADGEKKEIEDLIDNGKEELRESIGDVKVLTTLEIGDIGFTQMAIDESKGKRRILNGQLIIQEQYVQFTNIIKNSVTLNPDLACTEPEWQTEVTMNTFGLCCKFVIDDNAGTIRLPKYPDHFIGGVNNIAPVVGNGIALGFTDGTNNFGVAIGSGSTFGASPILYGTDTGTTGNFASPSTNLSFGITTDPTKSGIEAQIKQEQIKGTYFIQVATVAEIEDNIINEIELNNPFSLLDYKFSEYELNNLSWLRSNGQYNSKAIYPAVYDLLLKIYNGVEAKAGVSVKLWTDESATDYDFRINTAEETFRLPIITTNRVLIAKKEATTEDATWYNLYSDGWCEQGGQTSGTTNTTTVTFLKPYVDTNYFNTVYMISGGSNTNYYYGDNKTTIRTTTSFTFIVNQAESWVCNWQACGYTDISNIDSTLYFYVGETVQNANLINAGRIEEKLSNLIPQNKGLIASYGIPDYSALISISSGYSESNKFVAPTTGLLIYNGITLANAEIYVNDYQIGSLFSDGHGYGFTYPLTILLNKNDTFYTKQATAVQNWEKNTFIPLKGAK